MGEAWAHSYFFEENDWRDDFENQMQHMRSWLGWVPHEVKTPWKQNEGWEYGGGGRAATDNLHFLLYPLLQAVSFGNCMFHFYEKKADEDMD